MKISLIIPCYNEELNIQKGVLDRIGNYITKEDQFIEVLIIDDGSTDMTGHIIKTKYLKQFPKFRLVEKKHQGKAVAVITGIEEAKAEYVIFSDIDLATPLEDLHKIIEQFTAGFEIVIGSRYKKREGAPFLRKLQSVGFTFLRGIIIGLRGIEDTQCGFKGFKRETALQIIKRLQVFTHGKEVQGSSVSAGFDLEFLFIARKMNIHIKEVPVEWHHAETKNVAFFKDSIETIKDLFTIKIYDIKGKYKI